MKSAACIDYFDVSLGRYAGDVTDDGASGLTDIPTSSSLNARRIEAYEDPDASETPEEPHDSTPEAAALASADIHAVMLGLWASGLRYVIVYAMEPAIGTGPLAIGVALVIQVTGAAICVSGARSLWVRRHCGRCAYALVAALTCLSTLVALSSPAGF